MLTPLLGTLVGGLLAIAGGWGATWWTTTKAEERSKEERTEAAAQARSVYQSDTLHELQVAVLHLQRALVAYTSVKTRHENVDMEWDDDPDWDQEFRRTVGPLIDAMAVVQIIAGRVQSPEAASAAMVLHASAQNVLSPQYDFEAFASTVAQLIHHLDEGLAHGEAAIAAANEALAELPPPSSYRPLAPWSVRPG